MTTIASVYAFLSSVAVSLLLDRRAQVAFVVAFTLLAGLMLGVDGAEAKRGLPGGPQR